MRSFGGKKMMFAPNNPPDHTATFLIANSSGQALDYPSNAALMRVTYFTTAGVQSGCFVNVASTKAGIPTTGLTTLASSANQAVLGERLFSVSGATGFSVAAPSSGYVHCEFWGF